MSRKPMRFVLELTPPPGVTASDMRQYVEEAVQVWKGQYHPDDPRFGLDGDSVKVHHCREK